MNIINNLKRVTIWQLKKNLFKLLAGFNIISEKKATYGIENPNLKFYIINGGGGGLLRLLIVNLSHIIYATDRGWFPIVDLQNQHSQYLPEDKLHKENAWEYYFEQPCGFTLDGISKSKNIILSKNYCDGFPDYYEVDWDTFTNARSLNNIRKAVDKYIKYKPLVKDYLETEYKNILSDNGRVLGVLCRGTDYLWRKPPMHHVQPEPETVIEKAQEVMNTYNLQYLYLATEDQEIYELFQKTFGEKLLANQQVRFTRADMEGKKYLDQIESQTAANRRQQGLAYLSSINLLTKCNCFIGGRNSGTMGVYLLSKDFEYDYVWDLGLYPKIIKEELKQ